MRRSSSVMAGALVSPTSQPIFNSVRPTAEGRLVQRIGVVLAAGFICGLLAIVLAIGNATLLAHDTLAHDLPAIVGVVLFGAAVLPITTAFLSTVPGQITTTQEISVIALGAVVAASSAAFTGPHDGPGYLLTLLIAIGSTTVLSGLAMYLLGAARLGRIIRFVPFPVFGGFLAITGWYLLAGGLETAIGTHLSLANLPAFIAPANALKLVLVVAFVVIIELVNPRIPSGLFLPAAVSVAILAFNLVVFGAGIPEADLQRLGWIITVPASGISWPPVTVAGMAGVDWAAVKAGLHYAPFVVIVTAAAAMMNVSGIEIELQGDIDLDSELRSMGIGNIATGIAGGIAGFPGVSSTLLANRLGAAEAATGVAAGAVTLMALAFAPQLLGMMPAPLLGALLMWLGVSLLVDWVIKPLRTLRRREHAIIIVILAVSIFAGFPSGIVAGMLAALILFVFEYSRIESVQLMAGGQASRRAIPPNDDGALERLGTAAVVVKLSGFIFFGTSDHIVQRISKRLAGPAAGSVRFVIIDFRRVAGIDSSVVMSFSRLGRLATRLNITIALCGMSDEIANRLRVGGIRFTADPFARSADIGTAASWAESRLRHDREPPMLCLNPVSAPLAEDGRTGVHRPTETAGGW